MSFPYQRNIDAIVSDGDSDDDELMKLMADCVDLLNNGEPQRPIRTRRSIPRDRLGADARLMQDYFGDAPTYPMDYFRRRFRMQRRMFQRIVDDIIQYTVEPLPAHFVRMRQRYDGRNRIGFTTIQKCTSAIRQLAYGTSPDSLDEYLQMGETTGRECLDDFCKCVFELYSAEYLRKPTPEDIQRLYNKHEEHHGFPGMLGSIDCMHWAWKNCPTAWQGHYVRGDHGHPTIMLEAVASYDLWIWHAFFGAAGSNNDINVLNQSNLFKDLIEDRAPDSSFTVNGSNYQKGYYLADGIYPEWATFVKSFTCPRDPKRTKFKQYQESARKDVERAFGVLQGRWHIIKNPARAHSVNKLRRIMYTCIILHNMNVEDAGNSISPLEEDYLADPTNMPTRTFQERMTIHERTNKELRDRDVHHGLRHDLVEHIWRLP